MPVEERRGSDVEAVRRTVVLRAPVEAVWAALTEAGHLSAWLGGDVAVDAVPGGQIAVRDGNEVRRGVIVDLDPGRRLEFRWLPPSRRAGFLWGPDDAPAGSGGGVEFRLSPVVNEREGGPATPARTLLTVVERPPARFALRASASALA